MNSNIIIFLTLVFLLFPAASASITYNSGTDVITITNEPAVTCESIYLADQAGAWGQASKQGARQYEFTCHWVFSNSHFTSSYEFINFEKSSFYIRHNTASSFQLGLIDGNGNVYGGSTLRATACNINFWSLGGAAGTLKLYDSFIYLPGAYFRTYSGPTQSVEIIGCIIQAWSGGRFQGENEACILKNLYIHDATLYNFGPKGAGQIFDNIVSTRNTYGVYYSSPSGGYADGTMYNIKCRDNTYSLKIVKGTPGHLYLVNPDFDTWNFHWSGSGDTRVYRQYEFDLKVVDKDGNGIENVKVCLKDKNGVSIWGEMFTETLLLENESFEIGWGNWTTSGDLDWTRANYPTPTSSSGPDTAYDGSYYIYTEASGNGVGYPYKVSWLTYDGTITDEGKIDFWYHKYGIDCGPLEIHAYNGIEWNTIWSRSAGSEGNQWNHAYAVFPKSTTNLRFKSTTGDFAYADTALDLIKIYYGNINITCVNTYTNGSINTTILDYGYYQSENGNIPTLNTPYTLNITCLGYLPQEFVFNMGDKIDWTLMLSNNSICPSHPKYIDIIVPTGPVISVNLYLFLLVLFAVLGTSSITFFHKSENYFDIISSFFTSILGYVCAMMIINGNVCYIASKLNALDIMISKNISISSLSLHYLLLFITICFVLYTIYLSAEVVYDKVLNKGDKNE